MGGLSRFALSIALTLALSGEALAASDDTDLASCEDTVLSQQARLKACDAALKVSPDSVAALKGRGDAYVSLGQLALAIQDYSQAIARDPQNAAIFLSRGTANFRLAQNERAINDFNTAIALNPDDYRAYNNRGDVYSVLGKYREAVDEYNRADALKPDEWVILGNRANAFSHLDEYDKADADFTRATALDSKQPQLFAFWCMSLYARGSRYDDSAFKNCDKAISLGFRPIPTLNLRGVLNLRLGNYPAAMKDFEAVLSSGRLRAAALYGRGASKLKLGDYAGSASDMTEAVRLDPGIPVHFYSRNY